jgi:hypothetical protein
MLKLLVSWCVNICHVSREITQFFTEEKEHRETYFSMLKQLACQHISCVQGNYAMKLVSLAISEDMCSAGHSSPNLFFLNFFEATRNMKILNLPWPRYLRRLRWEPSDIREYVRRLSVKPPDIPLCPKAVRQAVGDNLISDGSQLRRRT